MEDLTLEEKNALIKEKPEYGSIVCRCEMITEGEIMDAINRPIGARTMDGVKRRTRAGMGRCQAGFCTPRTMVNTVIRIVLIVSADMRPNLSALFFSIERNG